MSNGEEESKAAVGGAQATLAKVQETLKGVLGKVGGARKRLRRRKSRRRSSRRRRSRRSRHRRSA